MLFELLTIAGVLAFLSGLDRGAATRSLKYNLDAVSNALDEHKRAKWQLYQQLKDERNPVIKGELRSRLAEEKQAHEHLLAAYYQAKNEFFEGLEQLKYLKTVKENAYQKKQEHSEYLDKAKQRVAGAYAELEDEQRRSGSDYYSRRYAFSSLREDIVLAKRKRDEVFRGFDSAREAYKRAAHAYGLCKERIFGQDR